MYPTFDASQSKLLLHFASICVASSEGVSGIEPS